MYINQVESTELGYRKPPVRCKKKKEGMFMSNRRWRLGEEEKKENGQSFMRFHIHGISLIYISAIIPK